MSTSTKVLLYFFRLTYFITFLSVILIFTTFSLENSYAESPSFSRQNIEDEPNDIRQATNIGGVNTLSQRICFPQNPPTIDLKSVSYVSDGKTLNATLWFKEPIKISPERINKPIENFRMIIHKIDNNNIALSDYIQQFIEYQKSLGFDIDLLEHTNFTMSNNSIHKLIYNYNHEFEENKVLLFSTIKDNNLFIFIYEEKRNPESLRLPILEFPIFEQFKQIISSLDFITSNSTSFSTYENIPLGIRFKYPANGIFNENLRIYDKGKFVTTIFLDNSNSFGAPFISIYKENYTSPNLNSEFYLKKLINNITEYEYKNLYIVNYTTNNSKIHFNEENILTKISAIDERENRPTYTIFIYTIVKDKSIYNIEFFVDSKKISIYSSIIEKIISSLDFITSNSTSFSTYENIPLGIRFKYPSNWLLASEFGDDIFPPKSPGPLPQKKSDSISNSFAEIIKWQTFYKPDTLYTREHEWDFVNYGMSIDIDSTYDTGLDTYTSLQWDNTNNTWVKYIGEYSAGSTSDNFANKSSKYIPNEHSNKIDLSYDLKLSNFPELYRILFTVHAGLSDGKCTLVDTSNLVLVPPPEFGISTYNSSIELRQGEKKDIPLHIQSKSDINSIALLNLVNNPNFHTNLTSKELSIQPFGTSTSTLTLETSKNSKIGAYVIPVKVDISFPQSFNFKTGSSYIYNFSNSNNAIITKNIDLLVTILPPLTWEQKLDSLVKWLSPINSIWTFITAIGAVLVPFIIRLYSKKSKDRDKEKDSYY